MTRFGLEDGKEHTFLKEIGQSLGVTRERIRQIENEVQQKSAQFFQSGQSYALFYAALHNTLTKA